MKKFLFFLFMIIAPAMLQGQVMITADSNYVKLERTGSTTSILYCKDLKFGYDGTSFYFSDKLATAAWEYTVKYTEITRYNSYNKGATGFPSYFAMRESLINYIKLGKISVATAQDLGSSGGISATLEDSLIWVNRKNTITDLISFRKDATNKYYGSLNDYKLIEMSAPTNHWSGSGKIYFYNMGNRSASTSDTSGQVSDNIRLYKNSGTFQISRNLALDGKLEHGYNYHQYTPGLFRGSALLMEFGQEGFIFYTYKSGLTGATPTTGGAYKYYAEGGWNFTRGGTIGRACTYRERPPNIASLNIFPCDATSIGSFGVGANDSITGLNSAIGIWNTYTGNGNPTVSYKSSIFLGSTPVSGSTGTWIGANGDLPTSGTYSMIQHYNRNSPYSSIYYYYRPGSMMISNSDSGGVNLASTNGTKGDIRFATAGAADEHIRGRIKITGETEFSKLSNWWTLYSSAYVGASSFSFTGNAKDISWYSKGLFSCLSKADTVTINTFSNYIKYDHNAGTGIGKVLKVGDIIYFTSSGTLPIADPVITTDRAYYVAVTSTGDSVQICTSPSYVIPIDFTITSTNSSIKVMKVGYCDSLTISGTTVTAIVQADTILRTGDNTFRLSRDKVYDFEEYIQTGSVEVVADASNPQGRRILDLKQPSYLLRVNSALGTAASGGSEACAWNIYSGASALFSSAQDMTTSTTYNYRLPTTKFVQKASNVTMRVTSVGGVTTKPQYLQVQLYLVPVHKFAAQ